MDQKKGKSKSLLDVDFQQTVKTLPIDPVGLSNIQLEVRKVPAKIQR